MTTNSNRSPRPALRTAAAPARTAEATAARAELLAEIDDLTTLRDRLLDFLMDATDAELAEFGPGLARVSSRIAELLDQLDA